MQSEIVLTDDGRVYHLRLKDADVADNIILVGDPERVSMVSGFLDQITFKVHNREFVTHTGFYSGKRVSVISTGIGVDNIDIVVNELNIAVNYNSKTKEFERKRSLNLIRLGTSGAIHGFTDPGNIVLAEYGLGIDGLFNFYKDEYGVLNKEMLTLFLRDVGWPPSLPTPYFVKCSYLLANRINFPVQRGISVTAPGFYGPQGRYAGIAHACPDLIQKLRSFEYKKLKILNFEMETSALYAIGQSLGHKTLTLCLVIANRTTGAFLPGYKEKMHTTIQKLLNSVI